MAEPLKYLYNQAFFDSFCLEIKRILPEFDAREFQKQIFTEKWDSLELKPRMYHVTHVLHNFFPKKFEDAVNIILHLVDNLKKQASGLTFGYMFLPDYIEQYGIDYLEVSLHAMENVTQFMSCEFAVRPFIIRYPEKLMKQMLLWSKHPHENVRRFASEGCRPRLPWAMALPALKNNPSPVLPILENLKNDSSEFVRKSVANNLNDISKDSPELIIKLLKRWYGTSPNTNWIVKHASRTLLKQGNKDLMELFGFASVKDFKIEDFKLIKKQISIGEYLEFTFKLVNESKKAEKIRLEYAVYYQKANSSLSKKVYMISEKEYAANSETEITRKQSFKPISTRVFHEGVHQVSMIINGTEFDCYDFLLM